MHKKADITKNEIRFRLVSPKSFSKLRVKHFSRQLGIYAVVGRRYGEKKTSVQSVRFKKSKGWTAESGWNWLRRNFRTNPERHELKQHTAVKIYDYVIAIFAVKSRQSNFPGEKFQHKFSRKTKAAVYGLADGSLLIKGKRPLWNMFKYSKSDL
jgi:hypothetical protein